ncbi:MAG TPA: hypothetical protein VM841_09065 [Actinomycetota bacterium]|nr:hypothetical protein [Actinomycetota bacterium]
MRHLSLRAALIAALMTVGYAAPALAHESRAVGGITMVVGWGTEPAYAGFMNNVHLGLTRAGQPMNDVRAGEVKVEVSFGEQKITLDLEPAFAVGRFGTPGTYRSPLLPTRAGKYTFRFSGSHDGQKIEGTFECGEQTFDCVSDPEAVMFPEKDPSVAELSQRVEREFPRMTSQVASIRDDVGSTADSARLFGIIGIVIGVIALVVALMTSRGRKAA